MEQVVSTIFFDGRFWLCIVERRENGKLSLAHHTFGSEPTNPQLRRFYLDDFSSLTFVECGETCMRPPKSVSFKKSGRKAAVLMKSGMFEKKSLFIQKAREERRLVKKTGE